ncbi:unnamed protein product, partial [Ixodes pacificus]
IPVETFSTCTRPLLFPDTTTMLLLAGWKRQDKMAAPPGSGTVRTQPPDVASHSLTVPSRELDTSRSLDRDHSKA